MFGLSMDTELAQFRLYLQRQNLRPKTIKQFCIYLNVLLTACDPFTPQTFEGFLGSQSQKFSAASLNKYVQTARKYVTLKKLDFPEDLLKQFKESPKTRLTFSDEEILRFLSLEPLERDGAYTFKKMTAYWSTVAFTGARPGEIAQLRQEDIDLSGGVIIIPKSKTGTGRKVMISPLLKDTLIEWLTVSKKNYVFPLNFKDAPFGDAYWCKDFNERIKRLGIIKNVQPYSFRHSYATKLLSHDAPLFAVQDILGHSDPKTTRIYYHGNLRAQQKAMAKDPLVRKKLGGRELIKQTLEYIDGLEMDNAEDINYSKILDVKKMLWEALIYEKNN